MGVENIELSKRKLAYLEELYSDYTNIDNLIATRVLELDHPWKQHDDNVGGGRSSVISRPQEQIVLKHEDDLRLQWLLKLQDGGNRAVNQFNDEQQRIFDLKFVTSDYYDWDTIGEMLGYSRASIYRKRYKLLELLGKNIGYC